MSLTTYHILSNIKFLKKYSFKFLFVAFLGIHIPLIGLIIFLVFNTNELNPISILLLVLVMTLIATCATLLILNNLLRPITMTKEYVADYINYKKLPELPTHYTDEVGILMKKIQFSLITLDDLLKEKQDLISLMSHDLKNPLAAVINYSELMITDPKFGPIAQKIKEASLTQKEIINSVLDLLENESIVITESMKQNVKISDIFEKVITMFEEKINNKNIKVNQQFNINEIKVNKNLFSQVITNILGNSLKYTENGSISINVNLKDNNVVISIKDTGIGFDQSVADRLFDRFTKYKRKGTQNENTTGLGLYLCKKIIERHGGSISAFSEGKGLGSEFVIKLPNS